MEAEVADIDALGGLRAVQEAGVHAARNGEAEEVADLDLWMVLSVGTFCADTEINGGRIC